MHLCGGHHLGDFSLVGLGTSGDCQSMCLKQIKIKDILMSLHTDVPDFQNLLSVLHDLQGNC